MFSWTRKDHRTSKLLCLSYFMGQVVCVTQHMYPSIRAFHFSAFFTDKLYSSTHTEAMQKKGQKEYISLRVRWSTEKCRLLDIAWLLHIWKYSSFCYLYKTYTRASHLKFHLRWGRWSPGSTLTEALLTVKSCWRKGLILFEGINIGGYPVLYWKAPHTEHSDFLLSYKKNGLERWLSS